MKNRKLKNIKYLICIIIYFVFGNSNLLLADITENFDNFTQSSYGNYLYNGFEITNGLCNSTNAKSGKAIRLRDATTSLEFVGADGNGKDGGVGVISFWHRAWDSSPTCVGL